MKQALVTGASSGIGAAIVGQLLAEELAGARAKPLRAAVRS